MCFSMDTVIYTSLVCTELFFLMMSLTWSLVLTLFPFNASRVCGKKHTQPKCMCGELFMSFANMDSIVFTCQRPECRSNYFFFFPKVLFNTLNVS